LETDPNQRVKPNLARKRACDEEMLIAFLELAHKRGQMVGVGTLDVLTCPTSSSDFATGTWQTCCDL
jgi:hypothetical protein